MKLPPSKKSAAGIRRVRPSHLEIEATPVGTELDLSQLEQVAVSTAPEKGGELFGQIVPLAGAIADASSQYGNAVVRFPEGVTWKDLMNRKTPGWEDWKQLTPRINNEFSSQAAIKQVGISPLGVANVALQGAAIVVGQAYMSEINQQLAGIESGIESIQQEMCLEHEAELEADFVMLTEYFKIYGETSLSHERLQAIHVKIEDIRKDARAAWNFQMKKARLLSDRIAVNKTSLGSIRSDLREFQLLERDALVAFTLLIASEQVGTQYGGDFSSAHFDRVVSHMTECNEVYAGIRRSMQEALGRRIEGMKGGMLAIPPAKEDDYSPTNVFGGAAHIIGQNVARFTPLAMAKEADRLLADRKRAYADIIDARSPIETSASSAVNSISRLNFIYNQADTVVIEDSTLRFVNVCG